ncbi:hypothetical protein GY45DRAFT_249826 [Cubamyces sp. BRFM 1775]|nr:hypothetical protein GY45DRAFT_249826 [Cubamyces sp. BRFM 1775]
MLSPSISQTSAAEMRIVCLRFSRVAHGSSYPSWRYATWHRGRHLPTYPLDVGYSCHCSHCDGVVHGRRHSRRRASLGTSCYHARGLKWTAGPTNRDPRGGQSRPLSAEGRRHDAFLSPTEYLSSLPAISMIADATRGLLDVLGLENVQNICRAMPLETITITLESHIARHVNWRTFLAPFRDVCALTLIGVGRHSEGAANLLLTSPTACGPTACS